MMTYQLDTATALSGGDDGSYTAEVSPIWWNFDSAFGGWMLAVALSAVKGHPDCRGDLVSLNAMFPAALKAGAIDVSARLVTKRARTDFWRVEIVHQDKPDQIAFSADLVMTLRRPTDVEFRTDRPDAPDPDTITPVEAHDMAPKWIRCFDQRLFEGKAFSVNERPRTSTRIRAVDDRPMDAKLLLTIADTPAPRVFYVTEDLRFGSTVSFSFHLMVPEARLDEIGTDYVLLQTDSDAIRDGAYDQRGRIWSRNGDLLAVTNQLAFFK